MTMIAVVDSNDEFQIVVLSSVVTNHMYCWLSWFSVIMCHLM